jgi:hypothetical protein
MLYIQHLVRNKEVYLVKEDGKQNVADLGTKHLPRIGIDKILAKLGMKLLLAGNMTRTADAGHVSEFALAVKKATLNRNEEYGILETKTLGVRFETNDLEMLIFGVLLGIVGVYLLVKVLEDAKKFLELATSKCRSLVPGPRAIPADIDVTDDDYGAPAGGDTDPNIPNLPLRIHHVRHRPSCVHLYRSCGQFAEHSVVETKTVCLVCLRSARRAHQEHEARTT